MKLIPISQVVILLVCLELISCLLYEVKYVEEQQAEDHFSEATGRIHCSCGNSDTHKDIPKDRLHQIFGDLRKTTLCKDGDSDEICLLTRKCMSCELEMSECLETDREDLKYDCYKRRAFIVSDYSDDSLKLDTYEPKMESNEIHGNDSDYGALVHSKRKRRQLALCLFPNLKTSDIVCQKYPSSVKCNQRCIFGYTLKEGTAMKMQCAYSENKWQPKGFEECRPFIDCTMTLLSAGRLSCTTATTKSAPECTVECFDYEDKKETKEETFKCLIRGGWNKTLPFCVSSGSGLDLVPAPEGNLYFSHDDVDNEITKKGKVTRNAGVTRNAAVTRNAVETHNVTGTRNPMKRTRSHTPHLK